MNSSNSIRYRTTRQEQLPSLKNFLPHLLQHRPNDNSLAFQLQKTWITNVEIDLALGVGKLPVWEPLIIPWDIVIGKRSFKGRLGKDKKLVLDVYTNVGQAIKKSCFQGSRQQNLFQRLHNF